MIIINVSKKLHSQLKALKYQYTCENDIDEFINLQEYNLQPVIIGSQYGMADNCNALKKLHQHNAIFFIELTAKHSLLEKKTMASFSPKAFINSDIDDIELNIMLNNLINSNIQSILNKVHKAGELKNSFLSNMSHEIRTPMNAIVGFSQLLGSPKLTTQKKQQYIEQINYNSNQLLKLIDDIIEISKIEAGKIKIQIKNANINEILDNLKSTFETHKIMMNKNHVQLIVKKDLPDAKAVIKTDEYRLRQILTNLIGNALKFTEEGSITFGYNLKTNDLEKQNLEFFVKDTGIGIKKEKLKYIFDRFTKIPASKTKLYAGTGLGLSISQNLTNMLGGKIWVTSQENIGSKFSFTIPYLLPLDSQSVHNTTQDYPPKHYRFDNKIVFIAEDKDVSYIYLNEILSNKGLIIHRYKNGQELIDAVELQIPDIILMDIKMPQVDGYEATRKIKKKYPKIPIIIQTAYAMKNERQKGLKLGADAYLEKPVNKYKLLSKIESLIS